MGAKLGQLATQGIMQGSFDESKQREAMHNTKPEGNHILALNRLLIKRIGQTNTNQMMVKDSNSTMKNRRYCKLAIYL